MDWAEVWTDVQELGTTAGKAAAAQWSGSSEQVAAAEAEAEASAAEASKSKTTFLWILGGIALVAVLRR